MTPPIEWIEITDSKKAELVVSKLDVKEKEFLLEALQSGNKQEMEESKESPRKALEKERKTAAIAELDRLGMKTDENIEKINAIQFLDDKILIGNTPWAYENIIWGQGTFKRETNQRYYQLRAAKKEAKELGVTLPEIKDFENTLKALPWDFSLEKLETRYKGWNILAIILWESLSGLCNGDRNLSNNGYYGFLGSYSSSGNELLHFGFKNDGRGGFDYWRNTTAVVFRPLVKNS